MNADAPAADPARSLRVAFSGRGLRIDFTAPSRGVIALFGPSGCGKSTVLGAIAGLYRPPDASIVLDGAVLQDGSRAVPASRRGTALVFQDSRLFPHLTVAANLRYGARRAARRPAREPSFDTAVSLLGLASLLNRRPHALSGGERQRVAIGRALLARPRLLLMDEPLASLDAERKGEILGLLQRLRRFDLPIVYVTHDFAEVAALADTVVLLGDGRVRATGATGAIVADVGLPLAMRDGAGAVLDGRIRAHDEARRLTTVACGGVELVLAGRPEPVGTPLRLFVPAREVALATDRPGAISLHNVLPATVRGVSVAGTRATVELGLAPKGAAEIVAAANAGRLLALVTVDAVERLGLRPGAAVLALLKSTSIEVAGAAAT